MVVVIAALVYAVMHGLWIVATAVLLFAGLVAWLGRKMFVSRPGRKPGA
jgi:hypothetical protein